MPWEALLAIALSYLLGCLNMAYYYVHLRQARDVRHSGSGNAGARNVGRLMGREAFAVVLLADAAKAALATWLGLLVSLPCAGLCAIAAMLGHIWPMQLQWRGGKGVACALGALLVLAPATLGVLGFVYWAGWRCALSTARAGLLAFLVASTAAVWVYPAPISLTMWAMTAILAWSHRHNITGGGTGDRTVDLQNR